MKAIGVIPARFAATRFPGKPLAPIKGKPMILWVLEAAQKARCLDQVLVATDHDGIAEVVRQAGGDVVLTHPDLSSGTDRVWAAVKDASADVVLNIQGDEPLLQPEMLDPLVEVFRSNGQIEMATLGRALSSGDLNSMTTAKIVVDKNMDALYFSRLPIPYSRFTEEQLPMACLKHIGIYAFRKAFLKKFCAEPPCLLEKAESLEQLRALYLGARIRVVQTTGDSWGVDTPEDIAKIEKTLTQRK